MPKKCSETSFSRRSALRLTAASVGAATGLSTVSSASHRGDDPATEAHERYDGIVVFRNDDPQPYWRDDALRDVTELFLDEAVPVTYGVVPATEEGAHDEHGVFCEYLHEIEANHDAQFELAMHGYTHEMISDWKGGSEFAGLSYDRQYDRLKKGKAAFEHCVGETPATFIAPGNTYDRNTARALEELGFLVASGNTLVADEFGDTGTFQSEGLYHIMETIGMYDWGANEFRPNYELEREFDRKRQSGEVYCQMLHYQHFTSQDRLDQLRDLIGYMKEKDVYFTTLGDLARGLQSGRILREGTDWLVGLSDDGDDGGDGPLPDVNGHPFESAIRSLVDRGVVTGYPDGLFRPERSLSRAEFATMIAGAFDPTPDHRPGFSDVEGHWARESIRVVAGAGFFGGYPDGSFRPDSKITKTEVLVTLAGGLGYDGGDPSALSDHYDDAGEVPDWARQSVADAHAAWGGIANYPDPDLLMPQTDATRAEAARYIHDASRDRSGSVIPTGPRTAIRRGSVEADGSRRHEYVLAQSDPGEVRLELSGPTDADLDLYVTTDGRKPTRTDYDRVAWSYGSDEELVLESSALGAESTLGILVAAYGEGGEYELRIAEVWT